MRGQGAVYHRLLPHKAVASSVDTKIKRQFQHPAFSHNGKYLAVAEMHFRESSVVRSDALVFSVPRDPKDFSKEDTFPLFTSGQLPGAPFFLRFSPDDESLAMLCSQPVNPDALAVASSESVTSLVIMDWARYQRKDSWASAVTPETARITNRKALTVLKGAPVFFTYTTASPKNGTIVAHCSKEVADESNQTMVIEKAVWMLQKTDTAGVADHAWKKICDSDGSVKWSVPICHAAGGGDSVLLVEDGWLVSRSLSRWKRGPDGLPRSKRLLELKGQTQFLVSADNSKAVVLEEDLVEGHYKLTVIDGEKALDPSDPSMGNIYELPCPRLTVAFWLSPDSTKVRVSAIAHISHARHSLSSIPTPQILLLTAAGKLASEVQTQRGQTRVALNSDMQWSVYNFPLGEIRDYEIFKPTPYFMKVRSTLGSTERSFETHILTVFSPSHCPSMPPIAHQTHVPFFSQYAQVFNPWSPDR